MTEIRRMSFIFNFSGMAEGQEGLVRREGREGVGRAHRGHGGFSGRSKDTL